MNTPDRSDSQILVFDGNNNNDTSIGWRSQINGFRNETAIVWNTTQAKADRRELEEYRNLWMRQEIKDVIF